MNKSVIILISIIWLLCTIYYTLARIYTSEYLHEGYAMAGAWGASILMLICIVIYIKKHRENKKK